MAPKPPTRKPYASISSATAAELAEPSPSKKKKKAPTGAPSKSPPPEKPAAAGEESSSDDEAEQRPTTNPSIPAPAGHFSSSEEDTTSSSGDEHEAEQRPNTNPSIPAPAGYSSSSEEDSSSSGDEHEAEQRRNTNPSILVPAGQVGDSYESDDEEDDDKGESVGSSNVTAKRGPSPPPQLQGLLQPQTPSEGNVPSPKLSKPSPLKRTLAELAEPFPSKKKKKAPVDVPSKSSPPEKPAAPGEDQQTKLPHMTTTAKEVTELPEKAVAAKKVAKLPEKAVAAKKVAKPPPRKKAAASATRQAAGKKVAKKPPPSKAVAAVASQPAGKQVAYNAEKHLEEKRVAYWYLAEAVNALDREHNTPGIYNAAFLNIADGTAAMLNAKIKKQKMDEAKLFIKGCDIKREVIRVMSNLIK